ncbi:MAG: tellurite resistance TerB family protein [Kofleriaceae bacterium]
MNEAQRQERVRALQPQLPADLAAGAGALKRHEEATDTQAAQLHAMLEVAYLAASADDKLDDAEIEVLVANLTSWLGNELDSTFLVELFEHLAQQLAAEGFQARLAACAKELDDEARRVAYKVACVTALADHVVHDDELAFLGGIADAFGIPAAEAQAMFDALDEAVGSLA